MTKPQYNNLINENISQNLKPENNQSESESTDT